MKLGVICPTAYLNMFAVQSTYHLILAHMIETDLHYTDFYKQRSLAGDFITLDNSSFELGDDIYGPHSLIAMALEVGATEIMAPEHFGDANKTIEKVEQFSEEFHQHASSEDFIIAATVHGKDLQDCIHCFHRLALIAGVDTIGLSCRLDFPLPGREFMDLHSTLRRSLCRFELYNAIKEEIDGLQFHLLGMNHPSELMMYKGYRNIRSHDSSACFIQGYHGKQINFGPFYRKNRTKLNFGCAHELSPQQRSSITTNIQTISGLIK